MERVHCCASIEVVLEQVDLGLEVVQEYYKQHSEKFVDHSLHFPAKWQLHEGVVFVSPLNQGTILWLKAFSCLVFVLFADDLGEIELGQTDYSLLGHKCTD